MWWYSDTVQVPPRYLASFQLHPARSCGFRLVVDVPPVERHTCDVCFRLTDLQHGHRRSEPSEALRNRFVCHECWHQLRHCGDCNVLPSELLESGWHARIKGEILLPCDLEISCTSGRLIDCAVCHRSIVNIARLQGFVEGPWKTHQALLLTISRSLKRFFTRSLTTSPMKLPQGTLDPARVTSDLVVFQKEAQYAVVSKSSADFKQWCHSSLAQGRSWCSCFLTEG